MKTLGELQRLEPRAVWEHEARDFTPWLRDHIDMLSAAVGLDLGVVETESLVGEYSVDLYAKDLGSNAWVVIENQLEPTDHIHLGQILAYAAGKEAGVVIWIATQFRDEHRQALAWLNEVTGESVNFFGIEIELLRVDDSRPAPHFRLVAQPNEWAKRSRQGNRSSVSTRQQAYEAFFAQLLEDVRERYPALTQAKRAYPQNWFSFPVGRTGFMISVSFTQEHTLRVELYIDTGNRERNKRAFDALVAQSHTVDEALGYSVSWDRLEDRQASRVFSSRKGSVDDAPEELGELREWAVQQVADYSRVFRPLVQRIEL